MAVAKRQGGEKPAKTEQRKVRGPRTGVRTSDRTNSTPGWPNLHRAGPGGGKNLKGGALRKHSLSPSPSLYLSVSLPLPPSLSLSLSRVLVRSSTLFSSASLGWHALML